MFSQVVRTYNLITRVGSSNFIQQIRPGFQVIKESRFMGYYAREIASVRNEISESGHPELEKAAKRLEKLEADIQTMEDSDSFSAVKDMMEKAKSTYRAEGVSGVAQNITDTAKNAINDASQGGIVKNVKEKLEKASEAVSSTIGTAKEKMSEVTQNITDTAKKAIPNPFQDFDSQSGRWEFRKNEKRRRQLAHKEYLQKKKESRDTHDHDILDHGGLVEYAWGPTWEKFRSSDPVIKSVFVNEETPTITDKAKQFFKRTQNTLKSYFPEKDKAMKEIQLADPSFNMDELIKEMKDYSLPEILECYFHGNKHELKEWASDELYNSLVREIDLREKHRQRIDCKLHNISDVEPVYGKLVNSKPILVLSFRAQQSLVTRDMKGNILDGKEGEVEDMKYVVAFVKESMSSPITGGWRLLEIATEPPANLNEKLEKTFDKNTLSKKAEAEKILNQNYTHSNLNINNPNIKYSEQEQEFQKQHQPYHQNFNQQQQPQQQGSKEPQSQQLNKETKNPEAFNKENQDLLGQDVKKKENDAFNQEVVEKDKRRDEKLEREGELSYDSELKELEKKNKPAPKKQKEKR